MNINKVIKRVNRMLNPFSLHALDIDLAIKVDNARWFGAA